ncbi:MAG: polymer-forming cytoskeletal protein [Deltaproteobacteria bacterium]|nr:polymer-forming cytoskeletal protein [Deltaproteobacteria bacterium]
MIPLLLVVPLALSTWGLEEVSEPTQPAPTAASEAAEAPSPSAPPAVETPPTAPRAPAEPARRRTGTSSAVAALQERVDGQEARLVALETRLSELETLAPEAAAPPEAPDDGADQRRLQSFGRPLRVAEGERVAEAVAFGAAVEVAGDVTGDVVSFGGDVDVRATGRVEGDAVSFGGEVRVEDGGTVLGDRTGIAQVPTRLDPSSVTSFLARGGSWIQGQVRRLVLLFSLAGTAVLVLGLAPDRVQGVARGLREHPVRYGFAGLLLTLAVTFVASLLAITLVGLPVSLVLLSFVAFSWLLGFTALALATGGLIPLPSSGGGRLAALLLGLLLLALVSMVPYVGKAILVLALFPCVGAAVGTRFGTQS